MVYLFVRRRYRHGRKLIVIERRPTAAWSGRVGVRRTAVVPSKVLVAMKFAAKCRSYK